MDDYVKQKQRLLVFECPSNHPGRLNEWFKQLADTKERKTVRKIDQKTKREVEDTEEIVYTKTVWEHKKQFATIRSMKNSIKEVKCFKNWIKDKAHDVTIRYNITQYREEVIILCRQLEQYLDQTMKRIEKDINTLDFEEKAIAYKFTCIEL